MTTSVAPTVAFDAETLRQDFPILATHARGQPLIYLDNAATSQKPQSVIDATTRYYAAQNGNIHRGVHYLSELATQLFDETRESVRAFVNAADACEIIFTRGTTESINLVANSFGHSFTAGDEIVVSQMEHHSNIVPWQLLCQRTGAVLRVVPVTDSGELDMAAYEALLNERTRLVSIVHVSNALGTINPVAEIIRLAHQRGIPVMLDGAQAAPHIRLDVQALGCDFFAFSAHKMLGPTGVGVLYGKKALLEQMPPWQGGGDMIDSVSFENTTFAPLPSRFEAGTPDIAGIVAFKAAIDYLNTVGLDAIAAHEHALHDYAFEGLSDIAGVRIIGTAKRKAGVLTFTMDCAHPHDIGTVLDQHGIAIRAGHHCAQPLMRRFGVPSTARASFYLYNTRADVDALIRGVHAVRSVFA